MPIDTSMYQAANQQAQNNDPLTQAIKVAQVRNAMNNVNKVQGGMPQTQAALGQLGAGQPYGTGQ